MRSIIDQLTTFWSQNSEGVASQVGLSLQDHHRHQKEGPQIQKLELKFQNTISKMSLNLQKKLQNRIEGATFSKNVVHVFSMPDVALDGLS